jgi:phosphatidate cytidylyltransferase
MLEQGVKPRSDLGVRTASGVGMMLIFGTAIWVNGWLFKVLLVIVALGLLREWVRLVAGFVKTMAGRAIWNLCGTAYIGFATWTLYNLREANFLFGAFPVLTVIAVDVGAYFVGRTLGGPKIAPKISPSKTWSGLFGGAIGSVLLIVAWPFFPDLYVSYEQARDIAASYEMNTAMIFFSILGGVLLAITAQSGDFFESWMKRKAGVKDSGTLIPGHGGLLDRMDGLLAVLALSGAIWFGTGVSQVFL